MYKLMPSLYYAIDDWFDLIAMSIVLGALVCLIQMAEARTFSEGV